MPRTELLLVKKAIFTKSFAYVFVIYIIEMYVDLKTLA